MVNGPGDRTDRDDALARVRELRTALKRSPQPARPPTEASEHATLSEVPGAEGLQRKYEMQLAAHRETALKLLADKDRIIQQLEEQLLEMRKQLEEREPS